MACTVAPTLRWRKSSFSGGNGGDCVELGLGPGGVAVRDSKNVAGPVLSVRDLAVFLAGVRSHARSR